MNEINCENVLMAKMAEIDEEVIAISAEAINLHLESCENCRREFELMSAADNLLKMQRRRLNEADLWSEIEAEILRKTASHFDLKPFILIGFLLIAYKLLEMIPEQEFGFIFRLVPLAFIVGLFFLLKENPFRINTELAQEI